MSFDHLIGTTSNTFYIGNLNPLDGYITIYANLDVNDKPFIRYDGYSNDGYWEFSNDGTNVYLLNPGGTDDHNLLLNLQGGAVNEYYHLDQYEYYWLLQGPTDGYWSADKLDEHNHLFGLQGGEYDGYYHLTQAEHDWLITGPADVYWNVDKGCTVFTSFNQGDLLVGGSDGYLDILPIGAIGEIPVSDGSTLNYRTYTIDHVTVGKVGAVTDNADGYLLQNLAECSDELMPAYIINSDFTVALERLKITCSAIGPLAIETAQVIVRVNNVDTALTATLTPASLIANGLFYEEDNVNKIVVSNWDLITVRFLTSAAAGVSDLYVNFAIVCYA